MLRMIPSKCPKCEKMVDYLVFWKKVGDKYFHVCEKCKNTLFSHDDCLRVGFSLGYEKSREDVREFLGVVKWK